MKMQILLPSARYASHAAWARSTSARSGGFSLIEVLVSIVILTIGMLGMVGMQAGAMQANREARLQSSATVLARELADMIRGNKVVGVLTSSNPYLGSFNSVPLVAANPSYCLNVATSTTACTSTTDIANAEMTEWLSRVDAELPGARVSTCFDSAPFDSDGFPQWTCSNTGGVIVIKIGWTRSSTNKSLSGASAVERTSDASSRPSIVLPVTAGSAI